MPKEKKMKSETKLRAQTEKDVSIVKIALTVIIMVAALLSVFCFASGAEDITDAAQADNIGAVDYIISASDNGYKATSTTATEERSDLAELLLLIAPTARELSFNDVKYKGSINIPYGVSLTGKLMLEEGNLTLSAGETVISELDLTLSGGSVRIKGGSVKMKGGTISALGASAVLLDYSSSAVFWLEGGKISCESSEAAIVSGQGSLYVSGGSIIGKYGAAIDNYASLTVIGAPTLSGIGTAVITSRPISLSYNESSYSGSMSVTYRKSFMKGSFTEVFFGATEVMCEKITLFDEAGAETEKRFFASSPRSDEKNFIAVYLPHTATFYSDGEPVLIKEFLSGERVGEPTVPEKEGYSFIGWFTELELKEEYNFGKTEDRDIKLYSSFSLAPPEFSISSLSFTYDEKGHTLGFDKLSHPLDEGGSYSYVWYKNSEPTSYSSASIQIKNVKDSGEYYCKLTFAYKGDFVEINTPGVKVDVKKREIKIPEFDSAEYTGERILPKASPSYLWTSESEGGTEAGEYPITVTLLDPENNKWTGSDAESVKSVFKINKAKNAFIGEYEISGGYVGNPINIKADVKFGTVSCFWSEDGFTYTDKVPTAPGKYYVELRVEETDNYYSLSSLPTVVELLSEVAVGIKLEKPPTKTEYRVFDKIDLGGAEFSVTYNSGRNEYIAADRVKISYKSGDCFLATDNSALAEFGGVSVPIPVVISAAEYNLADVVFENKTVTYNGKRHTIDTIVSVKGKDGIPLTYRVVGGGIDAGVYTVTLEFSTESINYLTPAPMTAVLTIEPMPLSVEYSGTEFIYDGMPKLPTAKITNADGLAISLTLTGGATDAGTYTATASVNDKNYTLKNPTVEYEILRADIDLSKIKWSGTSFTYNGTVHSITVSGLPTYVSIAGYANASFTDAGEYMAEVKLLYNEKNFNAPSPIYHVWEILPASYDMTGFGFPEQSFIFDGDIHYPKPEGDLPKGLDGSSPEYSFSAGATHVSEGRVAVTVKYTSPSKNYLAPESTLTYVSITPKSISVLWGISDFVYDGKMHLPSARSNECELTVSGSASDAGDYVATAAAVSTDYVITNPTFAFTIEKASNSWQTEPTASDIYEGDEIILAAVAAFGTPEPTFYSDAELKNRIDMPILPGRYYVILSVPESKNYKSLTSSPVSFDIIEVVPVSLSVTISGELVAMSRINEKDIIAFLENNNGTKTELSLSALTVEYESGEHLLHSHRELTLSFEGFSVKLPIEVKPAQYDMSNARWESTSHVYDGSEKSATLVGLPDGVSVSEYLLNTATNAGRYVLSATLKYDTDNYLAPVIPAGELVIEKQTVALPILGSAIYDAGYHEAYIEPSPLYSYQTGGGILPGSYKVLLTLTDSENYEFENGISELSFEILKRPVTVTVGEGGKSYTVTEGSILTGDSLGEEYYSEDGYIYLRASNPNYNVIVIPLEAATDENIWVILILILAILILLLGSYIFLIRRSSPALANADKSAASYAKKDRAPSPRVIVKTGKTERNKDNSASAEPGKKTDSSAESSSIPLQTLMAVDEPHANSLISDTMAKSLLSESDLVIETDGTRRTIVNIDQISDCFEPGAIVDINAMKEKGIIPKDARYVKVLAGGVIDKALTVIANAFSLSAIKMIALTGGVARHAKTVRRRTEDNAENKSALSGAKSDEKGKTSDAAESMITGAKTDRIESAEIIEGLIEKSDLQTPASVEIVFGENGVQSDTTTASASVTPTEKADNGTQITVQEPRTEENNTDTP